MSENPSQGNSALDIQIEALLLASGDAVSHQALRRMLVCSDEQLQAGLAALAARLQNTGVTLVHTDSTAALATAPAVADLIDAALRKAVKQEVGQAGFEVLATVLYAGPITRSRIDYIRGVNSSTTIRTLLARGLVERTKNTDAEGDRREHQYRPTASLLAHLGIARPEELPEYNDIREQVRQFMSRTQESVTDDQHGTPPSTEISAARQ